METSKIWLYILVSFLTALMVPVVNGLITNYLAARRIGLPVAITFLAPSYPPVQLFGQSLRRWTMHCPWPVSEWGRFCFYGWSIQDRGKIHEKLGPVFVMVTPYKNVVVVADPAAIGFILGKWRQFRKVPSIGMMATSDAEALRNITNSMQNRWNYLGRMLIL